MTLPLGELAITIFATGSGRKAHTLQVGTTVREQETAHLLVPLAMSSGWKANAWVQVEVVPAPQPSKHSQTGKPFFITRTPCPLHSGIGTAAVTVRATRATKLRETEGVCDATLLTDDDHDADFVSANHTAENSQLLNLT